MKKMYIPKIIQGGMGVNISCPRLARAVSMLSKKGRETLGTISGVTLEKVLARKLQQGGNDAQDIIRVLKDFPFIGVTERIVSRYYRNPKQGIPAVTINSSRYLIELIICANYVFVKLAKEGHDNKISINYLEKIAMPHLYAIFRAMLAGVDFVTMGAGIPVQVPAVFEAFVEGKTARYKIPVIGGNDYEMTFDPETFFGKKIPPLKKPDFIPIIASNVLGAMLVKKLPPESIYGFIIEEPTAGGHNAPPRNKVDYGPKDVVDYSEIAKIGLPFWIAGSCASSDKLKYALSAGASGIQAGSIFALCEESGMREDIREEILKQGFNKTLKIRTDMDMSPTGFPFKVVDLEGTVSESFVYESKPRVCDQCALVSLYTKPDGSIGYRCASEPEDDYEKKGGKREDTIGRGCICNGLIVTAGLEIEGEKFEPPVVTLGDNTNFLEHLMSDEDGSYTASDVVNFLLGD